MNSSSKSTSFIQFRYCQLCKISHKHKNKKHIYSLRHQQILKNILSKFRKKIEDCKVILKDPVIMKLGWESNVTVWCYFCEKSMQKHSTLDDCTVVCGSFIRHLALTEHIEKMNGFFWENILNKTTKLHYFIDEGDSVLFKNKAEKAAQKFCERQKQEISKNAEKIKAAARNHQLISQYHLQQKKQHQNLTTNQIVTSQHCTNQNLTTNPNITTSQSCTTNQHSASESLTRLEPNSQIDPSIENRKLTREEPPQTSNARKTSFGLTVIAKVKGGKEKGNIHTGAVPPWLQPDTTNNQTSTIGPSLQDLQAHLKAEKKKKLPANRVGADFSRNQTDSTWLPSFSGVWSNQRRSNTKYQFERRMRGNNSQVEISNSQTQSEIKNIKPYQRKKTAPATITSTTSNDFVPSTQVPMHGAFNPERLESQGSNTCERLGNQNWNNSCNSVHRNASEQMSVIPYKRQKISETVANDKSANISLNTSRQFPTVLPVPPFSNLPVPFSPDPKIYQSDLEKKSLDNPYNIKF